MLLLVLETKLASRNVGAACLIRLLYGMYILVLVGDYERIPYSPMCMLHNRMCHGPLAFMLSVMMLGDDAPAPVLKTGGKRKGNALCAIMAMQTKS